MSYGISRWGIDPYGISYESEDAHTQPKNTNIQQLHELLKLFILTYAIYISICYRPKYVMIVQPKYQPYLY